MRGICTNSLGERIDAWKSFFTKYQRHHNSFYSEPDYSTFKSNVFKFMCIRVCSTSKPTPHL